MEDMREKTHTRHYELYRQKRLEQMGFTDVDSDNKPVNISTDANLVHNKFFLSKWTLFSYIGIISANI